MAFFESLIRKLMMDSGTTFLTIILVFLLVNFILRQVVQLPPGPWGYPILGILPKIKKEFHLTLYDMSQQYGKIFSLKMGQATFVVLSDLDLIKKAFRTTDFTARPKSQLSCILNGYGIVNSDGPLWKTHRRYLINQKLGLRSQPASSMMPDMNRMEACARNECISLLKVILNDYEAKPLEPAFLINTAVANVICSMVMSVRFKHDDRRFQRFMFLFDEGFRLYADTGYATFIPALSHLPGVKTTTQKLQENRQEMLSFVKEIIESHRQDLDPENPRDLVDSYLIKMSQAQENNEEYLFFHGFDPEQQLEQIVLDLFSAGVETLKTTILWAILLMLKNPEVLSNVQAELDQVVGSKRLPELEDMKMLPYTRATLCEVMRRASVVPMGTTHATNSVVEFEGYRLPSNTHVVPLLHAIHMNPEYWPNPEQFNPDRFLNPENKTEFVKPKHFIPFGVGQRMCVGDQMAEKELFLLFSSLVHTFDVVPAPGKELPGLRGVPGITVTPQEFQVVCTVRHMEALATATQSSDIHTKTYSS